MMTVVMGMMTVVMVMIIIEEEYSDTIATLSPYICLLAIANGRQPKVMGFPHQKRERERGGERERSICVDIYVDIWQK